MATDTLTFLTDEDVERSFSKAKEAADHGPVFISGPSGSHHVLISLDAYRSLAGPIPKIADLLDCPGAATIELELPERSVDEARCPDLSSPI